MTNLISKTLFHLTVALAAVTTLASCDSLIYDDEGDCAPYYKVKFEYRYHLKQGDAFPHEVDAVTLYVIDAKGDIVWQATESGERLAADGYAMDVNVDPGQYTLVAWCGSGVGTHFDVNADATRCEHLHCYQARTRDAQGRAVSSEALNPLYHGRLEAQTFPSTQGVHTYTVPLVKDTNDINIILQQLSGEPMDQSMFEFTITDSNGWLADDNTPMADEEIDYRPHHTTLMGADISDLTDGYMHSWGALRAEHTTSRLMAPTDGTPDGTLWLTVRRVADAPAGSRADGDDTEADQSRVVIHVPLTSYCLAFKTEKYKTMTDQEYLDRDDTYNMVFFLDKGYRWMDQFIYINSFKVVLQNVDI